MSYLSPTLSLLVNAVKKSTFSLDRDFSEIEKLQSSVKGYQNFAANAYDKVAQTLKVELSKLRPDFKFVEDGQIDGDCFLICPIDGARNFFRGIPFFATTVVYCEKGEVKAAVVYNRATDEMFFAEKGNGFYKEGFRSHERLRVSANKEEVQSVVAVEVVHEHGTAEYAGVVSRVLEVVKTPRMMGAISLEMAMLGSGKIDICVQYGKSSNALIAGLLLAREAGGYIYDLEKSKITPEKIEQVFSSSNIAAANNNLESLVKKL